MPGDLVTGLRPGSIFAQVKTYPKRIVPARSNPTAQWIVYEFDTLPFRQARTLAISTSAMGNLLAVHDQLPASHRTR